jgi:hypothetical protein
MNVIEASERRDKYLNMIQCLVLFFFFYPIEGKGILWYKPSPSYADRLKFTLLIFLVILVKRQAFLLHDAISRMQGWCKPARGEFLMYR